MSPIARRWTALALLFAAAGLAVNFAAAADKDDAAKKDRQAYAGTWQATRIIADGNELKAEDVAKVAVVNEPDGKFQLIFDGNVTHRGKHTLDPKKTPKAIDMEVTEGNEKGKKYLGIYELKVDVRKVCYAQPGKDRPTKFESPAGSEIILAEFKRVKKN